MTRQTLSNALCLSLFSLVTLVLIPVSKAVCTEEGITSRPWQAAETANPGAALDPAVNFQINADHTFHWASKLALIDGYWNLTDSHKMVFNTNDNLYVGLTDCDIDTMDGSEWAKSDGTHFWWNAWQLKVGPTCTLFATPAQVSPGENVTFQLQTEQPVTSALFNNTSIPLPSGKFTTSSMVAGTNMVRVDIMTQAEGGEYCYGSYEVGGEQRK